MAQVNKRRATSMSLLVASHAERLTVNRSKGILVSIKTTEKYHRTRLPPLVLTWLQTLQPEQVGVVIHNYMAPLSHPPPPPKNLFRL